MVEIPRRMFDNKQIRGHFSEDQKEAQFKQDRED